MTPITPSKLLKRNPAKKIEITALNMPFFFSTFSSTFPTGSLDSRRVQPNKEEKGILTRKKFSVLEYSIGDYEHTKCFPANTLTLTQCYLTLKLQR